MLKAITHHSLSAGKQSLLRFGQPRSIMHISPVLNYTKQNLKFKIIGYLHLW